MAAPTPPRPLRRGHECPFCVAGTQHPPRIKVRVSVPPRTTTKES